MLSRPQSAAARSGPGDIDPERRWCTVRRADCGTFGDSGGALRAGLVMSMLSSKAKYALRAATFLAEKHREQTWALASDIAEAEEIPKKFLEAILVELRDHGVVHSRRGRYGGYRLAHAPSRVVVGDVIRMIDGPLALTPCSSRRQYGACADCVDPVLCALRPVLQEARDAVATVLDGCSLAHLVRGRRSKSSSVRRVVA